MISRDREFLSTPSVGRATFSSIPTFGVIAISIHALRGEGDPLSFGKKPKPTWNFYPRPPWGGRHLLIGWVIGTTTFLSTPSVGRATHLGLTPHCDAPISIHALRGEGDQRCGDVGAQAGGFLSTPSVGRATSPCAPVAPLGIISIHALRGEGDPSPPWRV